jgi:2-pyrone-4,6-dicarboxylate lactonase
MSGRALFRCLAPAPPGRPRRALPPDAWDCHFHVVDPRRPFALAPARDYEPPVATLADALALHDALGVARGVIVQISVYGTDNALLVEALHEARGRYRGVCVVDSEADDRTLDRLHEAGVRGARLNVLFGGGVGLEHAAALAPRLQARGWHLQLLVDVSAPHFPWPALDALGLPLVVDHFGFVDAAKGPDQPAFRALVDRVRAGAVWVKLSAPMRISRAPRYADVAPLARALAAANPARLLWGTDWPHVKLDAMPDAAALADTLADWGLDAESRRRILVENPAALYAA